MGMARVACGVLCADAADWKLKFIISVHHGHKTENVSLGLDLND